MARELTVVLAGGGTGGHVYPALAMGEALARRGHHIRYHGDPDRLEGRVVPPRGIPFTAVRAAQYPRAGLPAKLRFGLSLLKSVWASRQQLKAEGVDVVLGVGGYISAPPVLAAWTLGLPTAVHEANVTPGMANKLCARVADLVLLTYEASRSKVPGSAPKELVGCPVGPAVDQGDASAAFARYGLDPTQPLLLVVGGSLGAETLNRLGVTLARRRDRGFQIALIAGPRYHDAVKAELGDVIGDEAAGVALVGYEERMPDAYAAAQLVLCRSGSSTLAEITAVGLPSVLVPSPNVTDNHQEGNARGLEVVGAAEVVVERDFDPEATADRVVALMADAALLQAMGEAARGQARPDTVERVADLVEGIARP